MEATCDNEELVREKGVVSERGKKLHLQYRTQLTRDRASSDATERQVRRISNSRRCSQVSLDVSSLSLC